MTVEYVTYLNKTIIKNRRFTITHKKDYEETRMWSNWLSHSLLVGMQNGTGTL